MLLSPSTNRSMPIYKQFLFFTHSSTPTQLLAICRPNMHFSFIFSSRAIANFFLFFLIFLTLPHCARLILILHLCMDGM
uniref:Uncharacterized protein n=1 Tax=Meloidogyne enterolobii TaxID=390850 RepID=A0A6V7Y3H4_MELEN|nr:unnamed protein product [Meloidogyne enterolobii]